MSWDPCRPTPWEVARTIGEWSGDETKLDRILQSKEITIVPGPQTVDGVPRVELTPRLAMLNRKAFGFVVEIHESDKMKGVHPKK